MITSRSLPLALAVLTVVGSPAATLPAQAQLRGHGGPVRAVAVAPDGKTALSGSFDASTILWSLERNAAERVLRFHDSAVNAVAILPDGRLVTASQDQRIALWNAGADRPAAVLEGHEAPVVALAVSPDGKTLASASWDRTIRLWPLAGGPAKILEGHKDNVNGVAFTPDGKHLISAGYDLTVRIWPVTGGDPTISTLPAPLSSIAVAPDGEIVAGGADGNVYFLSPAGEMRDRIEAGATPLIVVAVSQDGTLVTAAGIQSLITVVARGPRTIVRTMTGRGLPVWAATFLPDSRTLLAGGADHMIRRWNLTTGEEIETQGGAGDDDPLEAYKDDRGATIFRACVACHTIKPDDGNRAGPTLAGIFGRRIATLPGYNFSPALTQLDIVWTPETVAKLFEVGPAAYTPGTKMPEQVIGDPADREALVKFLERVAK